MNLLSEIMPFEQQVSIENLKANNLFEELLSLYDINEIANELNLHKGTLKRWKQNNNVPENYYNDLNLLLDNKYPLKESFRQQDQFYTLPKTAKYCYDQAIKIVSGLGVNIEDYTFIEPSAGEGTFYELMPNNKRIGIDLCPNGKYKTEFIQSDYLKYKPGNGKYFVLGNPPFGLRGNLALRFINYSAQFADFVAFILPPLFDSTGKGVPMKRVNGYKLIHTEKLPLDSYYYPNGEKVQIATIFQIWSKFGKINLANSNYNTYEDYVKIYSLSNGNTSSSKRNVQMIDKCDIYLPSTCFSGMKAYKSFYELPNKRGYGLVVKKNKENIINSILSIDWSKVAFLSTNSALNLRTDLILNELVNKKLIGV